MNDTDKDVQQKLAAARDIMDDFAEKTGLQGSSGDIRRRYLWTDALAVQTFFGLSDAYNEPHYARLGERLIAAVHTVLGRHREDEARSGWISGLDDSEAARRPTFGGLRIGKKLPERPADEPADDRLEWDRDGQYFHYLTRWIMALLCAANATGESHYCQWAGDLVNAGGRFMDEINGRRHMYWKMSTDLTRPLVFSQGAQDPLEGLLCAHAVRIAGYDAVQERLFKDFGDLCANRHWITEDPLGLGGLLMHAQCATALTRKGAVLPPETQPHVLLHDATKGLGYYAQSFDPVEPAIRRLAFRECGLALGLRTANYQDDLLYEPLREYVSLAENIEGFWQRYGNQLTATWRDHQDINAVSLAASLVANAAYIPFAPYYLNAEPT